MQRALLLFFAYLGIAFIVLQREILLIDMAERMQLEVSDSEEALNITGDNLSGDEYAERPAVNAYGSPVNVSRIEPRLAVIQSPDQAALLSLVW